MKKLILTSIFIFMYFCSTFAGQLASGDGHSLALKQDGAVWAWGRNSSGELGNGTINDHFTPVQASGLTDVISISAGSSHSLALRRDGTIWAWGYNAFGQLGNGTADGTGWIAHPIPTQMIDGSGIIAIAGGPGCHSLMLKSDGTVWACGLNRHGQLGDGTFTDRSTPVQVIGLTDVISIASGGEHSLAIKSDRTVWAWGWNCSGQLGDGNGGFDTNSSTIPVQVFGLSNVIAIAGGYNHSLAVKNDGAVWAWGNNWYGQLGDGNGGYPDLTNSLVPVQSLISSVITIKAGNDCSLALTSYGTVWFWGLMDVESDASARLWSIIPVPVDGLSCVKAVAGGSNHALAIKNEGALWALGLNCYGQLGDGTEIGRNYPVQVQGFSLSASSPPASVMAADFDADGKADPTAVNTSGQLYFWHSSSSYSREGPYSLGTFSGTAVGDTDGDGRADMAIVDGNGVWYFFLSSRNYAFSGQEAFGVIGTPLLADFDGDAKADPAIVSSSGTPSTGSGQVWTVWLSADNYSPASASFAISGATPLASDFDGDGKADPVMVSSTGQWYLWLSGSMYTRQGPYYFGLTGKPTAGDFDGDGKADPAVMDSSGQWYFWLSGSFYTRDGPYYLVLP